VKNINGSFYTYEYYCHAWMSAFTRKSTVLQNDDLGKNKFYHNRIIFIRLIQRVEGGCNK